MEPNIVNLDILCFWHKITKEVITHGPCRKSILPGAGSPPPELAGRDRIRGQVRVAIARIRVGNSAKSILMVGLRGVGKTVLLDQILSHAEHTGTHTIRIEAPENTSRAFSSATSTRAAQVESPEGCQKCSHQGLRALAGFARALKIKYEDIEVGLDFEPEAGRADNGDLEGDLTSLLEQVGAAAKSAGTALVLFIDELQYLKEDQFAALISALHRCAQGRLPVTVVGAGLPQLLALAGNAKSYAERLFDFPQIGALDPEEAALAIVKPARDKGADYIPEAADEIIEQTRGYPYFLQEWGKHSWDISTLSPITIRAFELASTEAIAALDESFFRVRFDRLTPKEKQYLRAMAELGTGPHESVAIATLLNKPTNSLGPLRASLIIKGMIWSPNHGDTAFTVQLFDEFMKRFMPGTDW